MGIRYPLRKATQSLRFSSIVPACGNDWTTVFMIHKRELSDSMIESGSSLFYLFHCSAHDRLNTMPFRLFRNTPHGLHPPTRTPKSTPTTLPQHTPHGLHRVRALRDLLLRPLPQHTPHGLHLVCRQSQTSVKPLPQHTPHGLHQQNRTDAMPQIHAICCELVDSFSDATKAASALTIFPRFSTVKAIYIAIIDSLGRTIDRFFGANRTEKIC